MDPAPGKWVTDNDIALLTDQYQLAMLQAYWREGMHEHAVFSLFVRELPETRNFLLACGLDDALSYLDGLHFTPDALDYLRGRPELEGAFVEWLSKLRFRRRSSWRRW